MQSFHNIRCKFREPFPQKNEGLKSILERITYSKTKRLNWRVAEEDDLELHIEMKL